jgi:hypothetical protein
MSITADIKITFTSQPTTGQLIDSLRNAGWEFGDPFRYRLPEEEGSDWVEMPLDQWREGLREVERRWERGQRCYLVVVGPEGVRLDVSRVQDESVHIIIDNRWMDEGCRWPDFSWFLIRLLPAFEKAELSIYTVNCEASR